MTLLDDRPLNGLTTPYPGATYGWPSTPSLTTTEQESLRRSSRRVKLAVAGPMGAQQLPQYLKEIERKINRLLDLSAGWDGRRAACTTSTALTATLQVLLQLTTPDSLPVQLFPLPDGGIQIEWHISGNSLEIEVDGDGEAFVTAESSDGQIIAEGDLDSASTQGLMRNARKFLAHISRSAVTL